MGKLKKAPLIIGTAVVGIVAFRSLRKRRSSDTEAEPREENREDPDTATENREAPETATENAKAAVEHARQAAHQTKNSLPRTSR